MDGYGILAMLIFSCCIGILIDLLHDKDLKDGKLFSLLTLWIFASASSSSLYTSIIFTLNKNYTYRAYSCGRYDWIKNTGFSDPILGLTRKKAFEHFYYSVKWFSFYLAIAPMSNTSFFDKIEKRIFENLEMLLQNFGLESADVRTILLDVVLLALVYYNGRIYYHFFVHHQYFVDVSNNIDPAWRNNGIRVSSRRRRSGGDGGDGGDSTSNADSARTASTPRATRSARRPS